MPRARVSAALGTRLRRWNFILVPAVTFPSLLTVTAIMFSATKKIKKGSNQLLQTVTIATSSALNLHISNRGEKMKRSESLKKG